MKNTDRVTITFQPTDEVQSLLEKAQKSNPGINRTLFINEALKTYLLTFKGRFAARVVPAEKAA